MAPEFLPLIPQADAMSASRRPQAARKPALSCADAPIHRVFLRGWSDLSLCVDVFIACPRFLRFSSIL